ncbi:MAG TPA: GH116 family glycosyl-hydrolase, partial [Candidatus Acidoferrales bacterium]|nr:GH116 family glycosyl-hydrolase [Candidatus Acidoferrales bacterium]
CNCSGSCQPQSDGVSRRQFLGLVGTGVAMSLVGPSVWGAGAFELSSDELDRWKRSLTAAEAERVYSSDVHTDARMHLGGIGTGNFEIGADGRLTTWQLFNTLRDGQLPFYFAINTGNVAKLLQTTGGPEWPRVKNIEMTGEYPAATLRFRDDDLPVEVELTAFTPMEPLDPDFSSMPLAVFRLRMKNSTSEPQSVSLAAMMTNPVGYEARGDIDGVRHPNFGGNVNEVFRDGKTAGLFMRAEAGSQSAKAPGFGTLALATTGSDVTALGQFEDWSEAWQEFSTKGRFSPIERAAGSQGRGAPLPYRPTAQGRTINGAIASTVSIPPGGTVEVPFFFAWHYPNSYYKETGAWIGCYYATRWVDARAVVIDAAARRDTLVERTERYQTTFYDSTLPDWLLDCIMANSGIIRHIGVVFRIENGDIYGWEGSNGCCDPTCTHVWGYEQSLARLFPSLERDMRRIDFKHQQRPDGGINNRTTVPSPPHPTGEHPFADGHASCILKAYREALNCSDDSFFEEYWAPVKLAVEYLINRDATSNGGQPCGALQDDQWNTYDEALHGVTTFISGYYLAALRAGEEWARRMGERATADRFHEIFESGQAKLVELCWNGEYFQQYLPDYLNRHGEVGPGCMADQLLGQWWAHQLGLGYILPKDKVQSTLRSIFKYNWKSDLTGWKFMPRSFAGAHDKGLIICTWPHEGRPANVMLYSDEVWTGIEYQVAAHLIYEGFLEEGFSIAKGARDRYDGVPRQPIARNPWCEIECGGHYARAMSSWSLLLALSGWKYDGPRGELSFMPCYRPENFKSFFTGPEGWGSVAQTWDGSQLRVEIAVQSGVLRLHSLEISPVQSGDYHPSVTLAGKKVSIAFTVDGGRYRVNFGRKKIPIKVGEAFEVVLG